MSLAAMHMVNLEKIETKIQIRRSKEKTSIKQKLKARLIILRTCR